MRKPFTGEFLVIGKKDTAADAYLKLELLSSEGMLLKCMYRLSTKKKRPYPDLFDSIAANLEQAKEGNSYFIGEFEKLHTFDQIPKNYDCFLRANEWLMILQKNLQWIEHPNYLYELTYKILNAWNESKEAHTIFIKGLFVFADKEGYGVRQAWLNLLPDSLNKIAHSMIFEAAPVSENYGNSYIDTAKQLATSLTNWIKTETDIKVD